MKTRYIKVGLSEQDYQSLKKKQTEQGYKTLTSFVEALARNRIIIIDQNVKAFSNEIFPLLQAIIKEGKK